MLSINRLGLRTIEAQRRVKVMTLQSLRIAPHYYDIRSDLQRPLLRLPDERPADSVPAGDCLDDQANDLDSISRLQRHRRVGLQPANNPFFDYCHEYYLVALRADPLKATPNGVRIASVAKLDSEPSDVTRIRKMRLANLHHVVAGLFSYMGRLPC
jgi:hypothetical protein